MYINPIYVPMCVLVVILRVGDRDFVYKYIMRKSRQVAARRRRPVNTGTLFSLREGEIQSGRRDAKDAKALISSK
jgi:hypothetical protein